MFIPGHLATGALMAAGAERSLGRPLSFRWALLPALLGALTPDLVDKSLMYLGVFSSGRSVGHSVVVLAALTLVWLALRFARRTPHHRRSRASSAFGFWVLGIASHHLADFVDDAARSLLRDSTAITGRSFWPLFGPRDHRIPLPEALAWPPDWPQWPWTVTPLEAAVVAAVLVWAIVALRARAAIPSRLAIYPKQGSP